MAHHTDKAARRERFRRVGILGIGLIGGSIALAIRRSYPSVTLVGCDPHATTDVARIVDELVSSVDDLGFCDLVFVAVPAAELSRSLEAIARTSTTAVVTDVGSTKRRVMAAAAQADLKAFVGGHPMAGSERPGFSAAKADLFEGRPWLLVGGSAGAEAREALAAFLAGLGAVTRWMEADEHDRTVAYVSHLPQLVAAALMNAADRAVADDGPSVAGGAFSEMTRLASSPSGMWTSVFGDNADYVQEALETFKKLLPAESESPGDWAKTALEQSGEARARWRQQPRR